VRTRILRHGMQCQSVKVLPYEFNSGKCTVMTMNGVVSAIRMGMRMIRVSGNMGMRGNLLSLLLLLKRHAILLCLLSIRGDEVTSAANADGRVWET
jgi:hypothetical protein